EAEGAPTAGMQQVLQEQEKELAQFESEVKVWLDTDVQAVNVQAERAGLKFIITTRPPQDR
ncbi:MAG TPA: hypothetical protein VFS23_40980, partial [Vicinamibacterales bacterium]|nr:hypothetical protein [Vicinamibacterales bacterium]